MNKKYQVIALIGESGAGKDTIQRATCAKHPLMFNPIISCTTRPKRENEVDGTSYHFVSLEEFTKKLIHGEMLEAAEFRDWFYGTPLSSLAPDKINVGVFNPEGVTTILQDPRLDVMVVKVRCDDKTRLMRCLNREAYPDCEEICRRFFTDRQDFAALSLPQYYIVESFDGAEDDLLCDENTLFEVIKTMWEALATGTEFETICRWESSMSIKAESDKNKDNNE